MGCRCSGGEANRARDFALASAHLASEVVLLMQRMDTETPPSPAASKALVHAAEAAEELEMLAERGEPLQEAYRTAAWALQAAAVALAETRQRYDTVREASLELDRPARHNVRR